MSFFKLYQYAEIKAAAALEGDPRRDAHGRVLAPVEINDLIDQIKEIGLVEEVLIHEVVMDPRISLGHIKLLDAREEKYDEPRRIAHIRFHENQTNCWVRFVVCKELMHVFDSEDEAVFDPERFRRLLREIELPPMGGDESPMYTSEHDAEWMALLILCPKPQRDVWKRKIEAREVDDLTVAQRFRIPRDTVLALCSDYYDEVYEKVVVLPRNEAALECEVVDQNEPIIMRS